MHMHDELITYTQSAIGIIVGYAAVGKNRRIPIKVPLTETLSGRQQSA